MEDHQPAVQVRSGSLQVWVGLVVRGWALVEPQILFIMKKGYKQVNEKDF